MIYICKCNLYIPNPLVAYFDLCISFISSSFIIIEYNTCVIEQYHILGIIVNL